MATNAGGPRTGAGIGRRTLVRGAAAAGLGAGLLPATTASAAHPVLRLGSRGAAVKELQTKLAGAGYWLGAWDGSFGALTLHAVHALQKYHGLPRDGVCGPATWARVDLKVRPRSRYNAPEGIEIDKARQLLLVRSRGVVQMALSTSTGSEVPFEAFGTWYDGKTPAGTFKTSRYKPGWYTNELGALYRPVFFNGAIAIHGSTSVPPVNASHGCCRLSVQAQDWLLARGYLALGRQVIVY